MICSNDRHPNSEEDWGGLDGANIWLPYSQMKTDPRPLLADATRGARIRLADGRELIDGVGSWWTACHGYNHPHILAAMCTQIERMPHIMFGGITHEPALRLAKRIAATSPGDLTRVFFVDSGSVAVEVALKMAVQYWLNKGETGRTKFVHFRHGYHGDTTACMAVSDPDEGMHSQFGNYLPKNFLADLPRDKETKTALDDLLRRERNRIAAVIIEPIVQGAGGMKFHDAATLRSVRDLCTKHGVLMIADEIFTGFGRTGRMFACEHASVIPDIMCIGKGLTGGTVTLAATLARGHVFEAFWSDDRQKALMHGPTYMANPLACSAANASLDLFESEPRLEQAQRVETELKRNLEPCRSLPGVIDVRVLGAIGVVQFNSELDHVRVRTSLLAKGVWIRTLTDCIYLTPALNIQDVELRALTDAVVATAKAL